MNAEILFDANRAQLRPIRRAAAVGRDEYVRYAPMVRRIAMRVARRVPREVTVADLVAYGWLGLLEANERAAGTMDEIEFEAYASHRVRGAMLDYLRSLDPMVRSVRAKSRGIARAVATLSQELGRAPEEEEVAKKLALGLDEYRAVLQRMAESGVQQSEVVDFDAVEGREERADDRVERKMLIDMVAEAIDALPERLARVVTLHHREGRTLAEIGRMFGVTEARACQLHSEAMKQLRVALETADEAPATAPARHVDSQTRLRVAGGAR